MSNQDLPYEQYLDMLRQQMHSRATLFRKLVDEFGPGVLDIVQQQVIDETYALWQAADLPVRDLNAVFGTVWESTSAVEYTVEERTPECLRLRVTRCMYADEMRQAGAGDVGLAFYCAYDYGFCQGFNPHIRFTRTKTLMAGDDCCDHMYELLGGN